VTIERYTNYPPISEYLVIDELTTITEIREWCWAFVDVSGVSGNVKITGITLSVGNRIGRAGDVYRESPPGMQLIDAVNPVYAIAEKA
jgi:hypothetical protein